MYFGVQSSFQQLDYFLEVKFTSVTLHNSNKFCMIKLETRRHVSLIKYIFFVHIIQASFFRISRAKK